MAGKPLPLILWADGPNEGLTGCGNRDLLGQKPTAFFASRQCPGSAIQTAMDWALKQAQVRNVVMSGVHSPLAQGRMAVVSQAVAVRRLTGKGATQRNVLAAQLADGIVVAHASAGRQFGRAGD